MKSVLSFLVVLVAFAACSKDSPLVPSPTEITIPAGEVPVENKANTASPKTNAKVVEELIYEHDLYKYPELTMMLAVKDAQRTARLIREAGGTIVYDPNLSVGHDIGFLVADLPPKQILDSGFIESLELNAMSVDHPSVSKIVPQSADETMPTEEDLFVPLKDIKVDQFRKRPGNTRGKGMVVAVIDTGVDASHYAFQNRVIYWNDMTREGRTSVAKAEVKAGKITLPGELTWKLPAAFDASKAVYSGSFSEKALSVQFPLSAKLTETAGFDIDGNGLYDDEFRFVLGAAKADPSQLIAFVDTDGDKQLSEAESKRAVQDFNVARSATRNAKSFLKSAAVNRKAVGEALLAFPAHSRTRAFPLIFALNEKREPKSVTIGMDLEEHGTHVAGIIAGHDGKQVEGAAPEAEIMSLKVCSAISCTEQAILRGLVEAFYNPEGIVPDVVNISLGSLEGDQERIFNILMRDLSAKFGATFFVSASNSGPGYRTLNAFAATGPVIQVGAYVSRNTLMKHYTLDSGLSVPEHSLHVFTSTGPSYTGQFRPNIVAPGSAISSIPMSLGRSAMFNGTSMASPLAAGGAAALLGLARENDEVQKLDTLRKEKISALLNGTALSEPYSNIAVPMIMRTALEDRAVPMPHYTAAQRGHGLIDVDSAYEGVLALTKKVNSGDTIFADFLVNKNAKNGLYDRTLPLAGAKLVELALEADGEAGRETYTLNNQSLTVALDRVEVQSDDGSVVVHEGQAALRFFAVARRGVEGNPARTASVILSDVAKGSFTSVRRLAEFETGKTYLAHYNLYRSGQRIFSLLDVVHNPIVLPTTPVLVDVPALDILKTQRTGAFLVKDRAINANSFHRFPIAVMPTDGKLSLQLAISGDAGGSVAVTVYDTNGKTVGTATATRSPQLPTEQRIATVVVDASKNSGIYEVVVSAASGRWNGPSKYNLLVEPLRFQVSTTKVKLEVGKQATVVLGGVNKAVRAEVTDLQRLEQVKVSLLSGHWTFRRVPFPAESEVGPEFLSLEIGTSTDDPDSADFDGDLVPKLYYLKDGKTPEVAYEAHGALSALTGKLIFEDVERSGPPVYVAVETYDNLKGNKLSAPVKHYSLDILYTGFNVKTEGALTVQEVPGAGPFVVNLLAPLKLPDFSADHKKTARARATLKITSSEKEIKAEIPVTITQ